MDYCAYTNTLLSILPGLLAPPFNLSISERNDSYQILSWDAPFTLDITNLDPDITYRVCNNVTNATCVNITHTTYTLPIMDELVEYSVTACNPVGCSDAVTILVYNTPGQSKCTLFLKPGP